jgi:anti-repressor protein
MEELKIFNFENQEVRMQVIDGEPWFVAKDVCEILDIKNVSDAANKLNPNFKTTIALTDSGSNYKTTALVINEAGMYKLIFKSRKSEAERFSDWVAGEVLPAIRKHGGYLTPEKIEEALLNPDTLIQLATNLKEERTQRLLAEQRVNELQPKADYYDSILRNKSLMTISVIAKNYGMSAKGMNTLLHELGVQYNHAGTWLMYSKHQNKGYTHTEMIPVQGSEKLVPSTKWTQKGHIFIYELLKNNGVLPLIEQKDLA